ncbi:MAG: aquaporin Z [Elusimicrobia bacterium]|nr:aquaporin Z [Elusimicrobiota bacterium]
MRKYMAEMVGTFILVFSGVGSAVLAGDRIGPLGVSLAFGLALLAMAYSVGPVSGCHLNPAVSVGLLVTRNMKARDFFGYVVAQLFGAVLASALVLAIAQGAAGPYDPRVEGFWANGYGAHSPGGYNMGSAFLTEFVLTFVLMFTYLGTTDSRAFVNMAGIPIGLALALVHLAGIPITRASANPARSIGTAIFVGGWAMRQLWLFLAAPVLGALLAAAVHRLVRTPAYVIRSPHDRRAFPGPQVQKD